MWQLVLTDKSNFRGGNAMTANMLANLLILAQFKMYTYLHTLDSGEYGPTNNPTANPEPPHLTPSPQHWITWTILYRK